MKAVRLKTSEGDRWLNPDAVTIIQQLDASQVRVYTVSGTFEVRASIEDLLSLLETAGARKPEVTFARG